MTGIKSHPELALISALRSLRALSTGLSLAAALPTVHRGQLPVSTGLPTDGRPGVSALDIDAQCHVCQRQAALPYPHPTARELPAVLPAEEPPFEEPALLSSDADASPVLSHSPRHPDLIPSVAAESAPAVHGAGPVAVLVAVAAVPAAAEAPVFVPA